VCENASAQPAAEEYVVRRRYDALILPVAANAPATITFAADRRATQNHLRRSVSVAIW